MLWDICVYSAKTVVEVHQEDEPKEVNKEEETKTETQDANQEKEEKGIEKKEDKEEEIEETLEGRCAMFAVQCRIFSLLRCIMHSFVLHFHML